MKGLERLSIVYCVYCLLCILSIDGVIDQRDVWGLGVGRSRAAPLVLLNLSSTSSQADGLGWHRIAPLGLPRPEFCK